MEMYGDEWEGVWNALREGSTKRKSPFHTVTLATINEEGMPDARSVILRRADEAQRTIGFQGDIRSPKFRQVRHHAAVAAVFYSAPDRVQIRVRGFAEIHHEDAHTEEIWQKMYPMSQETYRTPHAPGEVLSSDISGNASGDFDPVSLDQAYRHFAAIRVSITEIDTLSLSSKGHHRIRFVCSPEGIVTAQRLAP